MAIKIIAQRREVKTLLASSCLALSKTKKSPAMHHARQDLITNLFYIFDLFRI